MVRDRRALRPLVLSGLTRLRGLLALAAPAVLIVGFLLVLAPAKGADSVWSGIAISGPPTPDPYAPPPAIADTDTATPDIETTIVAEESTVDIGNGKLMNAQTFTSCSSVIACSGSGLIPGPTFALDVGDTLTVRLVNHLSKPTGIHWHGAELANRSDGTPFTQNQVCAGCTLLYKFKAFRPGIFWYHPHHHASTNQTFRGLYGMIIVRDPNEAALMTSGTLPSAANTLPVVLSDTTICKAPGSNDAATYDLTLPWVGGATLPAQPGPTPKSLCEDSPIDDDGAALPAGTDYAAGDVPSIQLAGTSGRTNEGQTVLTNGVNVGARAGTPVSPGALAAGAFQKDVAPGQGLRLQLLNAAAIRYFRLRLTWDDPSDATSDWKTLPLVRIGGEAGLLDEAVVEGGIAGGFDTKYGSGEILLPPGSRADVVAAIPASVTAGSVLTLWTQDFQRTGMGAGWTNIPTVPVMHLRVMGAPQSYSIAAGTDLRLAIAGQAVETLGAATGTLLDPTVFGKKGKSAQNIALTMGGGGLGVDGVLGNHEVVKDPVTNPNGEYSLAPHLDSTRYAKSGDVLQLSVTNSTAAHHPYHPHGFSIQPISLTRTGFPTYTWPYREFRDNVDVPANYTLNYRVRMDPRPLADGTTPGGELGRWLFHCHIFFHAVNGMISELVVAAANGNEKPTVDVGGTWAYVAKPGTAVRHGTWHDPDAGDTVTLTASFGNITQNANGTWDWQHTAAAADPDSTRYVYITATDSQGHKDQVPFRLRIGGLDDGADNGDPHLTTTNGKNYDFQAVGEFTLLRDFDGLEIQARQTPVGTAAPIVDPYSGLTTCVSVNTAVAAQLVDHRVAIQPAPGPPAKTGRRLLVFLDGKAVDITTRGVNLAPGARVVAYPLAGGSAYELDYPDSTVLTVTPWFWDAHQIWLLNVSISRTPAYLGVMGDIAQKTWLPTLPRGTTVGPKPASLSTRYATLYKRFANAWRVTNRTSLFVYGPGTSTATFTDRRWPPRSGPCAVNPKFGRALATPAGRTIPRARAERVCTPITVKKLHADCVFDVSATGDPKVVASYLRTQELMLRATTTRVDVSREVAQAGDTVTFTATVAPLRSKGRPPSGTVTFLVDGKTASRRVAINKRGQARARLTFGPGAHQIMASYTPRATSAEAVSHLPSTSPIVVHTALAARRAHEQQHTK